ncbi:MAG: hypothetical protein IAX21_06110 [Candidatus Bathyarchaeota archaeon]|nr:hypothetical protein [Candidatus Bathyarchaeum tardum]WGM89473.1 MAG: hypothetical protein NUK63_11330 [Candidatus Bathyarchaeum tardum]WNZ28253.1 MAG: hypothetical protein IAX21_06110 [Candidatus Bathyarchaeota archaeon]
MNLKKLLASSCRQKIIMYLSHVGKTNIMKLVRETGSTYNEVNRNIQLLENEGIAKSYRIGHQRIIALIFTNKKTVILLEALTILNKLTICNQSNCKNPKIET